MDEPVRPPGADGRDADQDAATQLLLSNIRFAIAALDRAASSTDKAEKQRALQGAVDTYGALKYSVRHLGLSVERVALVNASLWELLQRIERAT